MTEEKLRFINARYKVKSFLVDPVTELLDATLALVEAERRRANENWRSGYEAGRRGEAYITEKLDND